MKSSSVVPVNYKRPLFVTRFGLSDRTAIGVQTKLLLDHFPDFLHMYWNEGLLDPHYSNSLCLERWPFARISALKEETPIALRLEKMRVSRWKGATPSRSLSSNFRKWRPQISKTYFAPIDASDARRMKEMARLLDVPFVVHLWDFLDNADHEPTHWLIRNAEHVFCLNEAILDNVR
jgi:hypothetical protein